MVIGRFFLFILGTAYLLICLQDIAPTYYDLDTFPKGEIKTALTRTAEKIRRRQADKSRR
jgi:hypothetical protein